MEPLIPANADTVPAGRARRLWLIVVLGGLSALGPLSIDAYLPALPAMADELAASRASAQLTLPIFMVGLAIGQAVVGPISDAWGRRVPLLIGMGVYVLISLTCALAPDVGALIVLRMLQGVAAAAGVVVALAMVRDLYGGVAAARVFASLLMISSLAPVAAPLAGATVLTFTSWRGVFVAIAVMAVLMILAALTVPETLPRERRHTGGLRESARTAVRLGRDPQLLGFALIIGCSTGAVLSYISSASFVLQGSFGLSPTGFSLVFAGCAAGVVISSQVGALLVRRLGSQVLLATGLVGLTLGCLTLLVAVVAGLGLPVVMPALFTTMFGVGLVMPNAQALAVDPHPEAAGVAAGHIGTVRLIVAAVLASLSGLGPAEGGLSMALVMTFGAAGAVTIHLTMRAARRRSAAR